MGLAAAAMLVCTPIAVFDGDGPIWCDEGPKIRLAGIAAREIDGTCRPHHPCPDASGIEARDALVLLLGGAKVFHADTAQAVTQAKGIVLLENWPPESCGRSSQENVWPVVETALRDAE